LVGTGFPFNFRKNSKEHQLSRLVPLIYLDYHFKFICILIVRPFGFQGHCTTFLLLVIFIMGIKFYYEITVSINFAININ